MLAKKSPSERSKVHVNLSHTLYVFCCKLKLKFAKIGTMLWPNVFYD